jgi:hypothetical protein
VTPISAVGAKITTIEAMENDKVGKAVQAAWVGRRAAMRLLSERPDHERHGAAAHQRRPAMPTSITP